jgi:hypothetical protein
MPSARRSWRCRSNSNSHPPPPPASPHSEKNLTFTYGRHKGQRVALDYGRWPLFGGPFLEAAVDSEQLILKYGSMRRTLDFRRLTVTDSPAR